MSVTKFPRRLTALNAEVTTATITIQAMTLERRQVIGARCRGWQTGFAGSTVVSGGHGARCSMVISLPICSTLGSANMEAPGLSR
jgi:hypothetical protein